MATYVNPAFDWASAINNVMTPQPDPYANLSPLASNPLPTLDQMAQGYATGDLGGIGASLAANTGGSGGNGGSAGPTAQDAYYDWLLSSQKAQLAEQQRQQRETASAFLANVLQQFGLGSLAGSIDSLIQQWGTNTDVIALKLKDTGEYKTRFKGLLGLQQRGITDVRNEAEYLQLETAYRQAFRENGLGSFLGESGTQGEYDKIADLVGKFSLSVAEVRERISDAQRVAADTPQEVRDALRDYYGIDSSMLVEYSLDPTGTAERMNRIANAELAGGLARQQGLQIGAGTAEQIAGLSGQQDIDQGVLSRSLVDALAVRDSTGRLAQIEQGVLTDDESVQASMQLDADAQKKVRGLQSRERARFSGSGGFTTGSLSGPGL